MVNLAREELAESPHKYHPIKPFVAPKLSAAPWMPDAADHTNSTPIWKSLSQNRENQPSLERRIQRFPLFQIRFLLSVVIWKVWFLFGRLAPQNPHLSTALNLSTAETVGVSPAYRQSLATNISEKARQRTMDASAVPALPPDEQFGIREQTRRDIDPDAEKEETSHPPAKNHRPAKKPHPPTRSPSHPRRRSRPHRHRTPSPANGRQRQKLRVDRRA